MVILCLCFFFFKQKTAYEMRISDWSSDVCSSDLRHSADRRRDRHGGCVRPRPASPAPDRPPDHAPAPAPQGKRGWVSTLPCAPAKAGAQSRSEEHTSELQSLMRISYAVFCLKKKKSIPKS